MDSYFEVTITALVPDGVDKTSARTYFDIVLILFPVAYKFLQLGLSGFLIRAD